MNLNALFSQVMIPYHALIVRMKKLSASCPLAVLKAAAASHHRLALLALLHAAAVQARIVVLVIECSDEKQVTSTD
jgi:hypothetical protein